MNFIHVFSVFPRLRAQIKQSNPHRPAVLSWGKKRVQVTRCDKARAKGLSPRKRSENPEAWPHSDCWQNGKLGWAVHSTRQGLSVVFQEELVAGLGAGKTPSREDFMIICSALTSGQTALQGPVQIRDSSCSLDQLKKKKRTVIVTGKCLKN